MLHGSSPISGSPGFPASDSKAADAETAQAHFGHVTKYRGFWGDVLVFFGAAYRMEDEKTKEVFSICIHDVVAELVEHPENLSAKTRNLVERRIVEITGSDTRQPLSQTKLVTFFAQFFSNQKQFPSHFQTEAGLIGEIDAIKEATSDIPQLSYVNHLSEIVGQLKPGDFLVRKYHEDNDNLICDLQKFFKVEGYREAYKCSHIAIYLGEIGGQHWIAEASMPADGEPEIRRIQIDDPRFQSKKKNQYLVLRNHNKELAAEVAALARNYAIKLLPTSEKEISEKDGWESFKYSFFEAARSLWHSPKLAFYGRHRLLKYYADYDNQIPFEYFGEKRAFFCSHFAMIMESMAEMKKSEKFQNFWKAHPAPVYQQGGGKIADIWYSIKKGIWARWMSLWYAKEINASVSTQLDALRTSPQDAVTYMMSHKENFEVVGFASHKGDFAVSSSG